MTLDPDTEALVRRLMSERGVSFKRALNDAIRAGVGDGEKSRGPFTRVRSLGRPQVDMDRALQLAGDLEDEELIRKQQVGK